MATETQGNNRRQVRIVGSDTIYSSTRECENALRKANNLPPVWQPGSALRAAINRGLPFCGVHVEFVDQKAQGADMKTEQGYLKGVAEYLGVKKTTEWYGVMWKNMSSAPNGGRLLNQHGNSVLRVLQALKPDVDWLEWLFKAVPNGFWDEKENRMRYMGWLAEMCACETEDDIRNLKTKQFKAHRGMGLLRVRYNNTPPRAVAEYLEWLNS